MSGALCEFWVLIEGGKVKSTFQNKPCSANLHCEWKNRWVHPSFFVRSMRVNPVKKA